MKLARSWRFFIFIDCKNFRERKTTNFLHASWVRRSHQMATMPPSPPRGTPHRAPRRVRRGVLFHRQPLAPRPARCDDSLGGARAPMMSRGVSGHLRACLKFCAGTIVGAWWCLCRGSAVFFLNVI